MAFGGYGGGIYNESGTTIMSNSTIDNNMSPHLPILDGGGTWNGGMAEITNSMITGNFAGGLGGGIRNAGKLSLTNSTVNGNQFGYKFARQRLWRRNLRLRKTIEPRRCRRPESHAAEIFGERSAFFGY